MTDRTRFETGIARGSALWAAFASIQGLAAAFLVIEAGTEAVEAGPSLHTLSEGLATLALVAGSAVGLRASLRLRNRASRAEAELGEAVAGFSDRVQGQFAQWNLTPAESEVALLTLKGYGVAEIARFRSSAQGTVRAQLSQIYEKAGASDRAQFVSGFIDQLIEAPPRPPRG